MCAYGEPVQDSIPATHLMLGDPGRDRPVLQRRSIMQKDTNVELGRGVYGAEELLMRIV